VSRAHLAAARDRPAGCGHGPDHYALPGIKRTLRLGPPVLGRGYIEAVDDAELLRLEAEQAARSDAIHGVVNRAPYASQRIAAAGPRRDVDRGAPDRD
jgi:hypothetical protein